MTSHPIAVFDSGLGGLTVLRALRGRLPQEDYFYFADTRFLPYGDRPEAFLRERGVLIAEALAKRGTAPEDVTVVVNTADDIELHGLWVSPDLDTVTYTLAGASDRDQGWGLAGETGLAFEQISAIFSGVADLKKAIFSGDITFNKTALECRYAGRSIEPREAGLSLVAASIEIVVSFVENLAAP